MKKILALLCFLAAMPLSVSADTLPFKQITIITHFPVGSGPDAMVRKIIENVTLLYNINVIF